MPRRGCKCGAEAEIVGVDFTKRYRCPKCGAEQESRESQDVDIGELGEGLSGDQLLSRVLTSNETIQLDRKDLDVTTPPTGTGSLATPRAGIGPEDLPTLTGASGDTSVAAGGIGQKRQSLGDYEIVELIGQGGMGSVYKALDRKLDRSVALKLLGQHLGRNPSFIERFKREARSVAKVSHPNITHIYAIGEGSGHHYFVMELVEGESLDSRIERTRRLETNEALGYTIQIANGLQAALERTGMVHRDIKPSNILIDPNDVIKITDFGLAKAIATSVAELTQSGAILGTPLYMSPEQGNSSDTDHRTDIYSLGATLYHMLYGRPPFTADTPVAILLKHMSQPPRFDPPEGGEPLSDGLVAVLRRMLAKSADDRYANYGELIDDLEKAREGATPKAAADEASRVFYVDLRASASRAGEGGVIAHSKLSIADANLRMGRAEKALSLLENVLETAPDLRVSAALRLLPIYEDAKDRVKSRKVAEIISSEASDPLARAVAKWHLGSYMEAEALQSYERALEMYQAAQTEDGPLPAELVQSKIDDLTSRIDESKSAVEDSRVRLQSS